MVTETLAQDLGFPEAPRWHGGRLWFSDFHDRRVRALALDGVLETVLDLDDSPSGLGWTPDGTLLVVATVRRQLLEVTPSGMMVRTDLTGLTQVRANDMVVDATGGAYVSSFGFDLLAGAPPSPTVLVRVDAEGTASVAAQGLSFPNGMALTGDGSTLVVAETPGLAPDGICLDAAGEVWFATARTPEVVRVREGGEVTGRVTVGSGSLSYACMLGGPDGRSLFVCTAPTWKEGGPRAGRIEVAQVAVPGAGRP